MDIHNWPVEKSELFENPKSSHSSISHQYFSIFSKVYFGDIHHHGPVIANSRKLFFSLSNIDFSDLGLTFSIERAGVMNCLSVSTPDDSLQKSRRSKR
jgi:hypothetical protein